MALSGAAIGQNLFITKEKIMQELEDRELDYEEAVEALKEEGIDLDLIEKRNVSADQIEVIQATILSLQAKKKAEELILLADEKDDGKPLDSLKLEDLVSVDKLESEEIDDEEEVYGQFLFRNGNITINENNNSLRAPDSYPLGIGDDVIISAWGRSQFENVVTVDARGYVRILDGRKRVYVNGLPIREVKAKLFAVYDDYYNIQLEEFGVDVNATKNIRVSIFGEVDKGPANFSIPAFNSVFQALSLVDGPNEIGSLRNITLRRLSGETIDVDLYRLLSNPETYNNHQSSVPTITNSKKGRMLRIYYVILAAFQIMPISNGYKC